MIIQEKAIEQLERISEHLSAIGEKEDYTDIAIQALEQQSNRCDSCIHSEEQDGSNCYECVKGMADNFEAQPTDADCQINSELNRVKTELEQQPCEDCISRQALIEKATNWDKHFADSERYVSLTEIQNTPSVTPQTRWIPVSERLPEERIAVLVWCPERKNIYCACYEEKQWWIFGAYFKKVELDVIALMPLPKSYKGESENME